MKARDITNQKFGKLTAISFEHTSKRGRCWRFRCDCGKEKVINIQQVVHGKTKSCGCMWRLTGSQSRAWGGYGEISGDYWCNLKAGALKRNHEFVVTMQYAWNLFQQQGAKCALTDLPLRFGANATNERSAATASLDRINSSKGYVEGNIQWVHKDVNFMKQNYDQAYFMDLCRRVVQKADGEAPGRTECHVLKAVAPATDVMA